MNIPNNIDILLNNHYSSKYFEYASEYGEPGYSNTYVEAVILGDWWCRCGKTNDGKLHSIEIHHPRVFSGMEKEGYEFLWSDEWVVVNDKAWRTVSDSHSWVSSIALVHGEWITPDDGLEAWIEEYKNSEDMAITCPAFSDNDFTDLGWRQFNGIYEHGLHPGQTDTPRKVLEEIRREHGEHVDWVFSIPKSSQFDFQFKAWIKEWE